jgi:hypothetical protein
MTRCSIQWSLPYSGRPLTRLFGSYQVLLCAWFSHAAFCPALYYMAMNYSIHGIMYFYFFLASHNAGRSSYTSS